MNIFVLDEDPLLCAQAHVDKHVVKMPLETAQILSTGLAHYNAPQENLYRPTHKKHPCTLWAQATAANFMWLVQLGFALCDEYTYRYGKEHASKRIIKVAGDQVGAIPTGPITPFAQAVPEDLRNENAVTAYRDYYRRDKAYISGWKNRSKPFWF